MEMNNFIGNHNNPYSVPNNKHNHDNRNAIELRHKILYDNR